MTDYVVKHTDYVISIVSFILISIMKLSIMKLRETKGGVAYDFIFIQISCTEFD